MHTVANQLRHPLRLLLAALLLLMLPFISLVPRVTAMDGHTTHAEQSDKALDCATACARTTGTPPPTAFINEDETRAPDPEPQETIPYHTQFQTMPVPKKLSPAAMYGAMPGRPPDIVTSSGHFLL